MSARRTLQLRQSLELFPLFAILFRLRRFQDQRVDIPALQAFWTDIERVVPRLVVEWCDLYPLFWRNSHRVLKIFIRLQRVLARDAFNEMAVIFLLLFVPFPSMTIFIVVACNRLSRTILATLHLHVDLFALAFVARREGARSGCAQGRCATLAFSLAVRAYITIVGAMQVEACQKVLGIRKMEFYRRRGWRREKEGDGRWGSWTMGRR